MIDEEYARTIVFGTRIAAGRFTIFMVGGLSAHAGLWDLESIIALMGFNNISFRNPLKAGDYHQGGVRDN